MKCKKCEYPLWDLAARVCPECGLGFSPVDYTFVINSVRFMCPHCRQDYYGTGEGGHLVPRRFNCVRCGELVDESEMVVLPTEGVSEVQTRGGVVPWREKKRSVWWRFFATIGQASFSPHRLARFAGDDVRVGEACVFGAVALTVFLVMCVGWCGALIGFTQTQRLGMQAQFSDIVQGIAMIAGFVLVPVAGAAVLMAAWAGVAQLVLSVGNPRPVAWGKTAECFAYAAGAGFLMAMPCFGVHLSPLAFAWMAVSVIIQLRVRHGVESGRAVLAGLVFPIVVTVLLMLWVALRIWVF